MGELLAWGGIRARVFKNPMTSACTRATRTRWHTHVTFRQNLVNWGTPLDDPNRTSYRGVTRREKSRIVGNPFGDLVTGVPRWTTPADPRNLGYPVGGDWVNSNIEIEIKFERGNGPGIWVVSMHKIQCLF